MSQQKPGSSDVQDLRARLGLKSQPAKADTAPSAPAPPPVQPAPTPAAPGVRHSPWPASRAAEGPGSNALLSRLMGPAAMPTPAVGSPPVLQPSPVPASVPYPSPAPLRPPPLDMDTEEETTGPGQPSPGLSTLPPPNMDPLAFLQQAPAVRRPSGVPVSAVVAPPPAGEYVPTPPPPQAPPPADPFASPWSGGLPRIPAPYPGHAQLAPQPLVAPEHMLGPGVGEVSMVTMSPGAKRRWLTTIAIALVLGLVGLGLGYVFGQIGKDRQIVNKRIDDATSVLASVEKTVALIKGIAPQIAKLSPEQPDYAQAEKMKTFSCRLALEEIIGDNLLLGRLITPDLVRYSAMANDFQDKVRRHGQLTFNKHKTYLEQIVASSQAVQSGQEQLFIYFHPNPKPGGPPPRGHLVSAAGQATTEGKTVILPIRPISSKDVRPVDIDSLVGLDRAELLQSAGPNVLQFHAERVQELKGMIIELDKLANMLINNLKREAKKEKVATF